MKIKYFRSYLSLFLEIVGLVVLNCISLIIRLFFPVRKGNVICWSYYFKQYSCNPKYLTEYILNQDYRITWAFRKDVINKIKNLGLDDRIRIVPFKSLSFLYAINTAEFIFTNCRTKPFEVAWKKRKGQKYIQLWHGGMALKKIEKDAEKELPNDYVKSAIVDSDNCDLMVSSGAFFTDMIKRAFWYQGGILECGTPRNDVFFDKNAINKARNKVCSLYDFDSHSILLLYAPTFRVTSSLDAYDIEWDPIIRILENKYNKKVTLLVRLHPNLIDKNIGLQIIKTSCSPINATFYSDMQELLCASDILVTDYSSTMFEMSLLNRPCFLYVKDIETYDRGMYFTLNDLPFPSACSNKELEDRFQSFDEQGYVDKVHDFLTKIGNFENGKACKSVADWMAVNRIH